MANTPADKPLITADLTTHPALKTSGIKQLKPPGPDSNYLDWSWILDIHFNSCGVSYILDPEEKVAELGKARTSYSQDNLAICAVIAKTIHQLTFAMYANINVTLVAFGMLSNQLTKTTRRAASCTGYKNSLSLE